LNKALGGATNADGSLVSALVIGNWYKVTFDAVVTAGAFSLLFRTEGYLTSGNIRISTSGAKTQYLYADQAYTLIYPTSEYSPNDEFSIDNISVKLVAGNHQSQATAGKRPVTAGTPIYANFDAVDDDLVATFPASLGAGCTVCRSLPATGASITTGVTIGTTYTDNVDAHALLIYTGAQWAALDAGQIAKITTWLNGRAGL